jgi:hypothetical protein
VSNLAIAADHPAASKIRHSFPPCDAGLAPYFIVAAGADASGGY